MPRFVKDDQETNKLYQAVPVTWKQEQTLDAEGRLMCGPSLERARAQRSCICHHQQIPESLSSDYAESVIVEPSLC